MNRVLSLDYARGFTVLCMPAIHSVMVYSQLSVHSSWFGYALTFVAEGPGAQVFMTIMGIAFTFRKHQAWSSVGKRAGLLLLAGIALNTGKFVLPFAVGSLPAGVYRDLELAAGKAVGQLLLLGDILHFAAIALVVIAGVYRLRNYWLWSIVLALLITVGSPLAWDVHSLNNGIDYALALFTGQPPRVFFPVLPWIVYPLTGLSIGYALQKNPARTFRNLFWLGLLLCSVGVALIVYTQQWSPVGFYRTYPGETLAHVGIVFLALSFWNMVSRRIRFNGFLQLLEYGSRHITVIYLIQWLLICWWLPFIGYQTLDTFASVIVAVDMTVVTIGFTEILLTLNNKYADAKNS